MSVSRCAAPHGRIRHIPPSRPPSPPSSASSPAGPTSRTCVTTWPCGDRGVSAARYLSRLGRPRDRSMDDSILSANSKIFRSSPAKFRTTPALHRDHRQLRRRACRPPVDHAARRCLARERACTPTVLTFDPHPGSRAGSGRAPKLLMTIEQRLRNLEAEGIEAVFLMSFFFRIRKLDAGGIRATRFSCAH